MYFHWCCYIWWTTDRIGRRMVNSKLISLFNKELIGVYLYIDVGCNRASYRVGRLLKGLYMYFCIVWGGSVLTDSWETCEGSGFLYRVSVFGGRGGSSYRELGDLWRVCISALTSPFCDLGNIEDSWLLRFSLSSTVNSSKFVSRVNSSKSFLWGSKKGRKNVDMHIKTQC